MSIALYFSGKNTHFHKSLYTSRGFCQAFVPCGGYIWMRRAKIILGQLNTIGNTELSRCVGTAKQSTSLLVYGGDLVYHGKEALAVNLPPFLLLVSC